MHGYLWEYVGYMGIDGGLWVFMDKYEYVRVYGNF